MLKKYDVIRSSAISHFISHLRITRTPRRALGNLTKGHKTMENISQTPIKPSVRAVENTIRVLFVCHGNICRSTMSQFVFQDMINQKGLTDQFYINSAATSREEIGNGPHYGTVNKMKQVGIPVLPHRAVQMTKKDYREYDYLIGMDEANIRNMMRIAGGDPEGKIHMLLDYSDSPRAIADPWYTGNFDITYDDVVEGCTAFFNYLEESGSIF